MKGLAAILVICLFAASSASAQRPTIRSEPILMISACLADAIQRAEAHRRGQALLFVCRGEVARRFYDSLGGQPRRVQSQGVRLLRPMVSHGPNDWSGCTNIVEDANGNAVDSFMCFLYVAGGSYLGR